MIKFKFSYLIGLAAFLLAATSGYYSIFGMSILFSGARIPVILMASSLEFSKVIVVSILEKYWKVIGRTLKIYLISGVVILVCITSAGIYGFLSSAYQKTASNLDISDGELVVISSKKGLFEKMVVDNQKIIDGKNARVQQLSNLRELQEKRIDASSNKSNRIGARADISSSSNEIQKLNGEIDAINSKNNSLSDSISYYANRVIEVKSKSSVGGEIGPLKYIADLTGYPMGKIINWFILLLIFVFDPLAVALVIATNKVIEIEKDEERKHLLNNKELNKKDVVADKKYYDEISDMSDGLAQNAENKNWNIIDDSDGLAQNVENKNWDIIDDSNSEKFIIPVGKIKDENEILELKNKLSKEITFNENNGLVETVTNLDNISYKNDAELEVVDGNKSKPIKDVELEEVDFKESGEIVKNNEILDKSNEIFEETPLVILPENNPKIDIIEQSTPFQSEEIIKPPPEIVQPKPDFVIPTGRIEVENIKEKKQQSNKGNLVQRITSGRFNKK
jgi:hypothetical protein